MGLFTPRRPYFPDNLTEAENPPVADDFILTSSGFEDRCWLGIVGIIVEKFECDKLISMACESGFSTDPFLDPSILFYLFFIYF